MLLMLFKQSQGHKQIGNMNRYCTSIRSTNSLQDLCQPLSTYMLELPAELRRATYIFKLNNSSSKYIVKVTRSLSHFDQHFVKVFISTQKRNDSTLVTIRQCQLQLLHLGKECPIWRYGKMEQGSNSTVP